MENEIIQRIEECSAVINDLNTSPAWAVITKDMKAQQERLDANWQDIYEPEKLKMARILKMAATHVLSLKQKYQEDLDSAQEQLKILKNPEKFIAKDYDTEGING